MSDHSDESSGRRRVYCVWLLIKISLRPPFSVTTWLEVKTWITGHSWLKTLEINTHLVITANSLILHVHLRVFTWWKAKIESSSSWLNIHLFGVQYVIMHASGNVRFSVQSLKRPTEKIARIQHALLTHNHNVELKALLHCLSPHLLQNGVNAHIAEVHHRATSLLSI